MTTFNFKIYFIAILFLIPPTAYAFTFEWSDIEDSMTSELRFDQVTECIVTTWQIPENERPRFVGNRKIMGHGVECDGQNVTYTHLVSDPKIKTPLQLLLKTISHLNKTKGLGTFEDISTESRHIFRLTRP